MTNTKSPSRDDHEKLPDWARLAGYDESEQQVGAQRHPARIGFWILLIAFIAFIIWAALAPLDNGVSMQGVVTVSGERKSVDTLGGGIVRSIKVADGDHVKAGQVVATLDPARARSELGDIDAQLVSAKARRVRLLAERSGASHLNIPEDLANTDAMQMQQAVFESRRASLEGQLGGIDASLAGKQAMLNGLQASIASRREQRASMEEQWQNIKELADGGYVPRNRMLELGQKRGDLDGQLASDLGQLGQVRGDISELKMRRQNARSDFMKEVDNDLADAESNIEQLTQRRGAASFELSQQEVRAPVDGVVVNLQVHTLGGVVQPGDKLMEVVPQDQPLAVEGHLPVNDIDNVHTDLPVELSFTAFSRSTTPRLDGRVSFVSADRLHEERDNQPYYLVRVKVPPSEVARLQGRALQAGMPVEVFVKTGERSLLNYLFKPLFDRTRTAWGD